MNGTRTALCSLYFHFYKIRISETQLKLNRQSCRPGRLPIQSPAVCYDFPGRQLRHLSSAYFQLLKPFLSFKSHITTVLIAQNVAKAYINCLLVYSTAIRFFIFLYTPLENLTTRIAILGR